MYVKSTSEGASFFLQKGKLSRMYVLHLQKTSVKAILPCFLILSLCGENFLIFHSLLDIRYNCFKTGLSFIEINTLVQISLMSV